MFHRYHLKHQWLKCTVNHSYLSCSDSQMLSSKPEVPSRCCAAVAGGTVSFWRLKDASAAAMRPDVGGCWVRNSRLQNSFAVMRQDIQLRKLEIQAANATLRQAGLDVHKHVTADAHISSEHAKDRHVEVMGCLHSIAGCSSPAGLSLTHPWHSVP